jgi:triacylglycerol lipase
MGVLVLGPAVLAVTVIGSIASTIAGVLMHAIVNDQPVDHSWENISCQTLELVGIFFTFLSQMMHFSFAAPKYKPHSPCQTPVMLIPGYQMNRWSLGPLQYYLHRCGYHNIWAINNPILKDDVLIFVEHLKEKIDLYYEQNQQRKIILIGHSMGGLICRHYIEQYGTEKVEATISLATPYRGTKTYRLARGTVGRQFKPDSDICNITEAPPLAHLVIRSTRDWVVVPFENTHLNTANEMIITNAGHLGILVSVPVFQKIHDFVDGLLGTSDTSDAEDPDGAEDTEGLPEHHA